MTEQERRLIAQIRTDLDAWGIHTHHLDDDRFLEAVARLQTAVAQAGVSVSEAVRAIQMLHRVAP